MLKGIKLGNLNIGDYGRPVFIAEIGINHNGSLDTAIEMVDAAFNSGADIIKFQHHIPEYEMVDNHEWQQLMKDCQLTIEDLVTLKSYVELSGAEFLCTPFCKEAADELYSIGVNGFKTGSGECNNIPLLSHIAQYQRPMLISTGMTSRDELIATLDAVRKINPEVVLLNCTSTYPATPREARLRRIQWLRSTFNLPVGQSDHTPTISTALGAVAQGAVCIEKHFTLDRNADGPDHAASVLPSEFKRMVKMGIEIWEGMQMGIESDMGILGRESKVRKIANHSVVASEFIFKGDMIGCYELTTMRPGNGDIPAARLEEVVGKIATRDIDAGELIKYTDIA